MYVPDNYYAFLEYERQAEEEECLRKKEEILDEEYDINVEDMIYD